MQDLRALVVDDSKVGRLTMMKKLEAMGVKVDLAESGQEALDYLARGLPDMVFMDHMMPGMDGFEVTRRIKAAPAMRHVPVIIVSGNDDAVFVAEARSVGAVDAIAKPPANDVLEALLAALPALVAEALAEPEAEPAAQPAGLAPTPVPAVDLSAMRDEVLAEVRALVARLVGENMASLRAEVLAEMSQGLEAQSESQRQALEQWRTRLDQQAADLADLGKGVAAAEALGGHLQDLERRLPPLEAQVAMASPDLDALGAEIEQRVARHIEASLAQGLADGLAQSKAEIQAGSEALVPRLDSLAEGLQALGARVDEHTAQAGQRAEDWDNHLASLAEDLARISRDQHALGTRQAEMEQHIADLGEMAVAAPPPAEPVGEDRQETTDQEALAEIRADQLAIMAELAELRESLGEAPSAPSEARQQEPVTETLDSLPPHEAILPVATEPVAAQPGAMEGLKTEVTELRDKLKTLTTLTAIGGVVLLAVIAGLMLLG